MYALPRSRLGLIGLPCPRPEAPATAFFERRTNREGNDAPGIDVFHRVRPEASEGHGETLEFVRGDGGSVELFVRFGQGARKDALNEGARAVFRRPLVPTTLAATSGQQARL